uniref:Uncharacterized protein n=1 Tax=Cannabis sativa TaxID=3483 RepID=A0A803QMS8_CANSA
MPQRSAPSTSCHGTIRPIDTLGIKTTLLQESNGVSHDSALGGSCDMLLIRLTLRWKLDILLEKKQVREIKKCLACEVVESQGLLAHAPHSS